jgi:hypothetical protein
MVGLRDEARSFPLRLQPELDQAADGFGPRALKLKWQLRPLCSRFSPPSGPYLPVYPLLEPPVHVIEPSGVSITTICPAAIFPGFV